MSNNFTERYTADGVSKIFGFNFPVPDKSWVDVSWMKPAATNFSEADGYNIELVSAGGNVIFNTPPPTGTVLLIAPKQPAQAAPSINPPPMVSCRSQAESDAPASLSALLFDEFKDSYRAFQKECSNYLEKMDGKQADFDTKASELLAGLHNTLVKATKQVDGMVEAAKGQTASQVNIVTTKLNELISQARTNLISDSEQGKEDVQDLRRAGLEEIIEKMDLALSKIDDLGNVKVRAITDVATDFNTKLASLYDSKAKQIKDFNLQVDGLVENAEKDAHDNFQQLYNQFKAQVEQTKLDIEAMVTSLQDALTKEMQDTIQKIKDTGDQACAELKAAQEKTLEAIKDTGEQACAELGSIKDEIAENTAKYIAQMEKCVALACEYKDMAYSAAGNKGWIVYRKIMPTTDAEIKELHSIINDGGLVIAQTEFPEDGGGNPTGGTDTQDFWCMVKQVAAYQEVVEKLLGNISPEDLENLHEYFEYLSNVLAELEKQEQLIKGLNITTASLDERIKKLDADVALLKENQVTQQAAIIDLQNKLIEIVELIDKNMEQNKEELDTQIKALKEEHERLGFLYANMDKRVTALEGK